MVKICPEIINFLFFCPEKMPRGILGPMSKGVGGYTHLMDMRTP